MCSKWSHLWALYSSGRWRGSWVQWRPHRRPGPPPSWAARRGSASPSPSSPPPWCRCSAASSTRTGSESRRRPPPTSPGWNSWRASWGTAAQPGHLGHIVESESEECERTSLLRMSNGENRRIYLWLPEQIHPSQVAPTPTPPSWLWCWACVLALEEKESWLWLANLSG